MRDVLRHLLLLLLLVMNDWLLFDRGLCLKSVCCGLSWVVCIETFLRYWAGPRVRRVAAWAALSKFLWVTIDLVTRNVSLNRTWVCVQRRYTWIVLFRYIV